jgi:hypothetical protein
MENAREWRVCYVERSMTLEEFRSAYAAEPFRPFTMHTADGRSIQVLSPEFVARDPTGRTVSVYHSDGRHYIIDLLLVSQLEFQPNGGTRPKRKR